MEKLIIRLTEDEQVEWLVADDAGNIIEGPLSSPLDELSEHAARRSVIVLVPTTDILLTEAVLPKTSRAKLQKALPYAIEEQLVESVEKLHFAISDERVNDRLPVAVVSKQIMETWREKLSSASLRPSMMLPDVFSLPCYPDAWSIVLCDHMAWVRTSVHSGFAIETDNVNELLILALEQCEERTPSMVYIHNYTDSPVIDTQLFQANDIEFQIEDHTENLLSQLEKNLNEKPAINLLQGDFQIDHEQKLQRKFLRYAGILGAAWFAIVFIGNLSEYFYLSSQNKKLNQEISKIYMDIFPNATSVVSPKSRIEQELQKVQSFHLEDDFLALLQKSGKILSTMRTIKIQNLTFRDKKISLSLQAEDFEVLDKVLNTLRENNLDVKQESATSKGDKVDARFVIQRKS